MDQVPDPADPLDVVFVVEGHHAHHCALVAPGTTVQTFIQIAMTETGIDEIVEVFVENADDPLAPELLIIEHAHTLTEPTLVGQFAGWPLLRHLGHLGCRLTPPPADAVPLHIGPHADTCYRGLRCWADSWRGVVSSTAPTTDPVTANEIGGIIAGALAVGDAFRSRMLGDVRVGRRVSRLSAFSPGSEDDTSAHGLEYLPRAWWLLSDRPRYGRSACCRMAIQGRSRCSFRTSTCPSLAICRSRS